MEPDDDDFFLDDDFSSVFLFRSSKIFFSAVDLGIMLNCLYLALWATNFYVVVNRIDRFWQGFMLFPLLSVMPVLVYTVKICSKLKAVSELNLDVVGRVLEEAEDTERKLRQMFYLYIFETFIFLPTLLSYNHIYSIYLI